MEMYVIKLVYYHLSAKLVYSVHCKESDYCIFVEVSRGGGSDA